MVLKIDGLKKYFLFIKKKKVDWIWIIYSENRHVSRHNDMFKYKGFSYKTNIFSFSSTCTHIHAKMLILILWLYI